MRDQLTIGKKLAIGVTAFMACLVVLSITSLRVISTLGGSLDAAVNSTGKELDLAGGAREALQELKGASLRAQIAYVIAELQSHSTAADRELFGLPYARLRRREPPRDRGRRRGG